MNRSNNSATTKKHYRILVVDDEQSVRNAWIKALSLQGYDVYGAASGAEALSLMRDTPFTLMILDMKMPGMDGITVMRKTREILPHLLILVITAHASLDNAIAAVKSQAVDFLQKPVPTQLLCETVRNLLTNHAERMHRNMLAEAITSVVDSMRLQTASAFANGSDVVSAYSVIDDGETMYVPPISLDRMRRYVTVDHTDAPVAISEGEAVLLGYLMENANQLLTSRQLAFRLLGDGSLTETEAQRLVRPYLSRLRTKIPVLKSDPPILRTVRRRGYMFVPRKL